MGPKAGEDNAQNTQTVRIFSLQGKNPPTMSSSGELTTERIGRPLSWHMMMMMMMTKMTI